MDIEYSAMSEGDLTLLIVVNRHEGENGRGEAFSLLMVLRARIKKPSPGGGQQPKIDRMGRKLNAN